MFDRFLMRLTKRQLQFIRSILGVLLGANDHSPKAFKIVVQALFLLMLAVCTRSIVSEIASLYDHFVQDPKGFFLFPLKLFAIPGLIVIKIILYIIKSLHH